MHFFSKKPSAWILRSGFLAGYFVFFAAVTACQSHDTNDYFVLYISRLVKVVNIYTK